MNNIYSHITYIVICGMCIFNFEYNKSHDLLDYYISDILPCIYNDVYRGFMFIKTLLLFQPIFNTNAYIRGELYSLFDDDHTYSPSPPLSFYILNKNINNNFIYI